MSRGRPYDTGDATQTPLATRARWAASTGILGALGCWLVAAAHSGGRLDSRGASASAMLDEVVPGPVYGRIDSHTLPTTDLVQHFRGRRVRHLSLVAGDHHGVWLPPAVRVPAVSAGAVLVVSDEAAVTMWVPSVDPATHRPSVVLTAFPLTHRHFDSSVSTARSVRPGVSGALPASLSAIDIAAGSAAIAPEESLPTLRSRYQQALLEVLTDLDRLNVTLFDGAPTEVVTPARLPRKVDAATHDALATALGVCAVLDRARDVTHNSSAGRVGRERLREVLSELGALHTASRDYADALWASAYNQCR